MLEFFGYILNHPLNPFNLFGEFVELFVSLLALIPPPLYILLSLAVVIFIIRLIPL